MHGFGSGGHAPGRCGGDPLATGSDADGDGPVGFTDTDELADVEMLVMGVAEQDEDFDIGEADVGEPLIEVVYLAPAGGGVTSGVLAAEVASPHGNLLKERWFTSPADVFEHLASTVLEAEVQVAFHVIKQ